MPTSHTKRDTLFEFVEAAVRAPSADRHQSWTVALDAEEIRRFADRARELAVTDPDDRELTISCGAALYNLRLVSPLHGLEATVESGAADVPRVEMRPSSAAADHRLADAIDLQRTHREGFRDEPLPPGLGERLAAVVAEEGATAVVADEALRAEIADLVAQGDRLHFAGRRWRRELASLVQPRRRADGVTHPEPSVPSARTVVSAFDVGARAARHDRALALSAPLLVLIATAGDTSADWLKAGEGLEHLLLEAADAGLQGSFLNQPCRTPELRDRLRALLPGNPYPQLIVRIGFPDDVAP